MTKFYTGSYIFHSSFIPSLILLVGIHKWCVFDVLFNLASKYMPRGTKLSKFTAFVIFFIKIRLSLQDEDISFRFGCHVSTVCRSFHRVLDILFMCTAECIKWPDRDGFV